MSSAPKRVRATLAASERTLPRILEQQAARLGELPFISFGTEEAVSFARMDSLTNRLARSLQDLGLERGDRLALVLPNCRQFVELWFAASKLGAIEVPINPDLRGGLLAHPLTDAAPKIIACQPETLPALEELGERLHCRALIIVSDGSVQFDGDSGFAGPVLTHEDLLQGQDASPVACPVKPSDPIALLYTSGTTGAAKGVVMPHLQFWAFVEGIVANLDLGSADLYYTPLPLFHADAQLFGAYFPLMYGARGVIDPRFSASRFWQRIEETQATATNLLGAMAHILWKAEPTPHDAETCLQKCQAIPMVDFRREFEERFGIKVATGYGQTETNFITRDTPDEWRAGSCGKPAPGYEVQIVDDQDQLVAPGATGEITVRHREPFTICLGYFNNPAKTAETARNLWWHTGDAGHLDEDGWLYFDGRIKDAIRRRGENVSAHEVETIVNDHPDVLESAAIAVPAELSEDEIMVVVSPRTGHELTPQEVLEHCASQMPRYMVPRYVRLWSGPLPRTPSEKIAKQSLREEGVTPDTCDRELDESRRT